MSAVDLVAAFVLLFAVLGALFGRMYYRAYGKRVVTCPETHEPAAVELDALRAALTAAVGRERLELRQCSRWPERRGCGQECIAQIREAPEGCLVRNILADWYEGKSCALCGKRFDAVHPWWDDPALLRPDGSTVDWAEVRAEELSATLSTCRPVCWSCHLAESFRREHPELVLDR